MDFALIAAAVAAAVFAGAVFRRLSGIGFPLVPVTRTRPVQLADA